eukprot:g22852.t1
MGELQEHEDSVAAVQFWGPSLITGSSDGQVCIWRCSDYELLLKFRGHKASVTCLAVHPSGRMMASAGRDQRIQLWDTQSCLGFQTSHGTMPEPSFARQDLTRGTSAAHLSVLEAVEALEWSPDGQSIAALSPRDLVAVEVASNSVASFKDPASAGFMRVSFTAVAWLSSKVLALGDGRGQVQIFEKEGEALTEVCKVPRDGNVTGRIKALIKVNARLMVGLSTGLVWSLGDLKAGSFTLLRVVDTKSRLTCMTVWAPGQGSQVLEDKHPKGKRTSGGEKPVKKEQERSKKLTKVREELEQRSHLRQKGVAIQVREGSKDKPAQYRWLYDRKR